MQSPKSPTTGQEPDLTRMRAGGGGFGGGDGGRSGGDSGGGGGRCGNGDGGGANGGWPLHAAPASSACESDGATPQPLELHASSRDSVPSQATLSSQTGPLPSPYDAQHECDTAPAYPSCRHTTSASTSSHPSSVTVPHAPAWKTSTRPSPAERPPARRTRPSVQGAEGGGGGDGGANGGGGVGRSNPVPQYAAAHNGGWGNL